MREVFSQIERLGENDPHRSNVNSGNKRVMFRESGGDLSFDATKVFSSEGGILTNANSPSNDDLNRSTKQVYNGMSRRCRTDLLRDEGETREAPSSPRKVGNITSRWLREQNEAEREPEPSYKTMSPRKFSVSKIKEARSGPPPKSDDFFSELKQWHQDYALRNVEAPQEIKLTNPMPPSAGPMEAELKEAIAQKETNKAASEAKKALAKVEKEYAKKKKEEKVMLKEMDQEAKNMVKKDKKKFWGFLKRKQKQEKVIAEETPATQEPEQSILGLSEECTEVSRKESESEDHITNILKLESETNEEPAEKLEIVEAPSSPKKMVVEAPSAPRKTKMQVFQAVLDEPSSPRKPKKEVLVETVMSAESSCNQVVEKQDSKLEPEGETSREDKKRSNQPELLDDDEPISFVELLESVSWLEEASPSLRNRLTVEKEGPWMDKTGTFLKEKLTATKEISGDAIGSAAAIGCAALSSAAAMGCAVKEVGSLAIDAMREIDDDVETEMDTTLEDSDLETLEQRDSSTLEDSTADQGNLEVVTPRLKSDGLIKILSGFFKVDPSKQPPMMVVEVDEDDVDKYEAETSGEESFDEEMATMVRLNRRELDRHLYSSFDNELRDEVDAFLQTQCAWVTGQRRMQEGDEDEPSWLELATGFFSPKSEPVKSSKFGGDVTVGTSVGGQTEKMSNSKATRDVILSPMKSSKAKAYVYANAADLDIIKSSSNLTTEEIKMIESYEDNIMTLPDGTRVIKMAALMQPPKRESQTCDDSPNHKKKSTDNRKKSKKKAIGGTLFGSMSSPKNSKKKNKDKKGKKNRGQTLF